MQSANLVFLWVSAGLGSCLGLILLLYNIVAAVLFMREETEGTSSGLAKAAWALGIVALLTWPAPCVGSLIAIAAMMLSRVERGRIYRDESSLAGATPVRMGSVNGGMALLLQVLVFAGIATGVITGSGGEVVAP
ncbi:MAG TPA: hypothetical protein ENK18_08955 [Deltaproteobacteria bacterium]|nr:hypothetical protein [Deltaproteobacteria bacterium]